VVARVYTGVSREWHDDYERGRPGWPPQVVDVPGLEPASAVLELGAGTGKLTRLLAATFASVVAVEPDPGMRRVLATTCPEVEVRAGSAESIPAPDASVDAVFAAESFHWFDGAVALPEIARVLRPGGALVLLWNVLAGRTEPSLATVEAVLEEVAPTHEELGVEPLDLNTDRYASGVWRGPFDGSAFEPLHDVRMPNPQTVDADGLVAFYASLGWVSELPDARREALLARVRSLLVAPAYTRPWETQLHWARLDM
jgi:SAM-dependent methyltransferase